MQRERARKNFLNKNTIFFNTIRIPFGGSMPVPARELPYPPCPSCPRLPAPYCCRPLMQKWLLFCRKKSLYKSLSKLYETRTCTPDGWHPKHYGLLGDETLQTLSLIIMLMFFTGQAPTDTQQLQVLTQRKHKGVGRRPLGFYNAIARLVGKLLAQVARDWDCGYGKRGGFSMAKRRSPSILSIQKPGFK